MTEELNGGCSQWIAFDDQPPPESCAKDDASVRAINRVLVTNNLGAHDRMGRKENVWLASPIWDGNMWIAFDEGNTRIEALTHWFDPFASLSTSKQAGAEPVAECRDCHGTGVDGDFGPDGRTIDIECGACNGTGRTRDAWQAAIERLERVFQKSVVGMVPAEYATGYTEALSHVRRALAATPTAAIPAAPSDAEIIALNEGECFFSESPSKYPEYGFGTQYHTGKPGLLQFARAVLALTQPTTVQQAERVCGNPDCGWKGSTDRMLGSIGPLCPKCGETTEENNS